MARLYKNYYTFVKYKTPQTFPLLFKELFHFINNISTIIILRTIGATMITAGAFIYLFIYFFTFGKITKVNRYLVKTTTLCPIWLNQNKTSKPMFNVCSIKERIASKKQGCECTWSRRNNLKSLWEHYHYVLGMF